MGWCFALLGIKSTCLALTPLISSITLNFFFSVGYVSEDVLRCRLGVDEVS